jgi:hypothetical protein
MEELNSRAYLVQLELDWERIVRMKNFVEVVRPEVVPNVGENRDPDVGLRCTKHTVVRIMR